MNKFMYMLISQNSFPICRAVYPQLCRFILAKAQHTRYRSPPLHQVLSVGRVSIPESQNAWVRSNPESPSISWVLVGRVTSTLSALISSSVKRSFQCLLHRDVMKSK